MEPSLRARTAIVALALVCAWPLVNFFVQNAAFLTDTGVALKIIGAVYAVTWLAGTLALLAATRLLGAGHRNRLLVALSVGVLVSYLYGPIVSASEDVFVLLGISRAPQYGYAAVFLLLPSLALLTCNRYRAVQVLLTVVGVGVTLAVAELAWTLSRGAVDPTELQARDEPGAGRHAAAGPGAEPAGSSEASASAGAGAVHGRPNIYHVILDEYARADQLEKILGFDNGAFIAELHERGYQVLPEARANYPYTLFSLSSMFSMSYLYDERTGFGRIKFDSIVGNVNPAIRALQAHGYRYGHMGSNMLGGSQCVEHPEVLCLTPRRAVISTQELEILDALLRMTPLSYFISIRSKAGEITTVDDVRDVAASGALEAPFLVFAHTLPPHEPYTRRADCSEQPSVQFYLQGGLDPAKYLESLQCVNRRVLGLVDYLNEHDPDAIVLIHSDHGSKFLLEETWLLDAWTKEQFDERFGVFAAIKAPPRCRDALPPDLTLVNLYPFVLSCLEGTEPEFLEDRFYNLNYDPGEGGNTQRVYRFPDGGPAA